MKKLLLTVISLFVCLIAMSQETQREGNFLSRRYNRITYDTNYIARPDCKWTFKLRTMMIGQTFYTRGEVDDEGLATTYESDLISNFKPKLNVQVGYMGIALAGGISFKKLAGQKDRDFDIKLNMYGKSFGFELGLSGIESLHGNYIFGIKDLTNWYDPESGFNLALPLKFEIPEGKVSQAVFNFNFYYALNNKKFSYPAAFTQMFLQKKSAGSLLVGGELHANVINIGDTLSQDELFRLRNVTCGLGVGYGYNFVLPRHWLLHVSALPYLVLYSKTQVVNYMSYETSVTSSFPEVFIIGRVAVVHDFTKRWFAGATGQLNWSNVNSKKMVTGNSQYQIWVFVGVRL